MTVEEAKAFNPAAVVEVDGQVLENAKVKYTYKKNKGLFSFLSGSRTEFPTEPGEYTQTASAAGNYSSDKITRTIVIE